MTIQFYVSEDGEVLSNMEFPVRGNLCIIPKMEDATPVYGEVASVLFMETSKARYKLFKAMTIRMPDVFVKNEEGILR